MKKSVVFASMLLYSMGLVVTIMTTCPSLRTLHARIALNLSP